MSRYLLTEPFGASNNDLFWRAPVAKARVVSESESTMGKAMETAERGDTEKGQVLTKLEAAVEKAKEVCQRLQDQTAAAARATDKAVREHPYQATGIAFGLGILIGVLVSRSLRD